MQSTPEFTALRRRWRWLLNEVYVVQSTIDMERLNHDQVKHSLDYRQQLEQELEELDWVFRFIYNTRNGYHLTRNQLVILVLSVLVSVAITFLIARGGA